MKHVFHDNQISAANRIIDNIDNGIMQTVLIAQMQSGKTGTVKYVVKHIIENYNDYAISSNNVYFICGMNDNDLRRQMISEFDGLISADQILFSYQLQMINSGKGNDKLPGSDPGLIIIDESHYASCVNSQVDKFMRKYWDNEECYTISVSATPMAELVTADKLGKELVYLTPGETYYGIEDIVDNELLFQSASIDNDNYDQLIDIIDEEYTNQRETRDWKYMIIRTATYLHALDICDALKTLDYKIGHRFHYSGHPGYKANFNDYVTCKPRLPTIIWIHNSLRAGKQLDTRNIGLVHDTPMSTPDCIAQSLLGRIMGYSKDIHEVKCYTDMRSAMKYYNWVQNVLSPEYIPSGCRNVSGGTGRNLTKNWVQHIPILVKLTSDQIDQFTALKVKHRNRYPYKQLLIDELLSVSTCRKLHDVLKTYNPGTNGGLMVLTDTNTSRSFKTNWDLNYDAIGKRKAVRGFIADENDGPNQYYIYVNLNKFSNTYGYAVVTYKEIRKYGKYYTMGEHDGKMDLIPDSRFTIENCSSYGSNEFSSDDEDSSTDEGEDSSDY